jgi:EmrB/QacA subfamily drug resistance transporter
MSTTLEVQEANLKRDPRRWFVLAVMSVGTLIVFLDTTVMNTALPNISTELRASTSNLQWVLDSYVLVLAGLLMLGGSIGDRYGRRNWMTIGLIIFGAGSVFGALASNIEQLIVARGVQGLGAALVLPATLSILTNVFDRDERPKAIAIWTAVGGLGIGLGPAVGGYLVDRWDWSAAFWVHVPVIVAALIGQIFVPESRDPRNIGLDIKGAFSATFGITALVFGIIQGSEAGWTSPQIVGSFALAAVLLVTFAQVERTAEYPMLPLHFFKQKDFTGGVLVLGLAFFSAIVMFFFLVQYFQLIQGRSPFETGLMVLPNAGAIVVAAGIAQWALPKFGPRSIVSIGVSIMALGVVLFTTVDIGTSALSSIVYIMVFGFGFGLASQPLTDTVMAAVPVEDAGIGSAVNDVSRELGSALGIAILGSIVSSFYRSNIESELDGQVPDELIEMAGEGLGVLGVASQELEPDVAATLVSAANTAFIDAMTSGFWFSFGFLGLGVLASLVLLPKRSRDVQVVRVETSAIDVTDELQFDLVMIPGSTVEPESQTV